jgi:hypothetical protein
MDRGYSHSECRLSNPSVRRGLQDNSLAPGIRRTVEIGITNDDDV